MTRSASTAPVFRMNVTALLVIGSILFVKRHPHNLPWSRSSRRLVYPTSLSYNFCSVPVPSSYSVAWSKRNSPWNPTCPRKFVLLKNWSCQSYMHRVLIPTKGCAEATARTMLSTFLPETRTVKFDSGSLLLAYLLVTTIQSAPAIRRTRPACGPMAVTGATARCWHPFSTTNRTMRQMLRMKSVALNDSAQARRVRGVQHGTDA